VKVVFSSPNYLLVAHYRGLLESAGIPCHLRNEYLAGAAGELPPTECWPELCVEQRWEGAARAAIAEAQAGAPGSPDWTCPGCGEGIEGQFTACWNCGRERGDRLS
jgi:hypothetical protein